MYTQLVSEYRFDPSENAQNATFDLMHYGYICVVDENSNVIFHAGDTEDMVFYRSASKPIQALPVFAYKLDEKFGIGEMESVILSASHVGEEMHIQAVEDILRKGGFSEDILCMKPTKPTSERANEARIRDGLPLRKIYHTCSGKHTALLLIQKYLGGAPQDYWREDAPVFKEILDTICLMAETDRVKVGVDGCGVPVFAVPMKNIAVSYKNLACTDKIQNDVVQAAADKNIARIAKYPDMISGENYLSSVLDSDPNIIAKDGANGVLTMGLKEQRIGIAVKLVDGTQESWAFLALEILRMFGALTPEIEKKMEIFHPTYFVNDNERIVGQRKCEFLKKGNSFVFAK
ncbi:MAG: asparaginase [Coprococcus sp.]|nr:asparaginase [Coprococcus sp.]